MADGSPADPGGGLSHLASHLLLHLHRAQQVSERPGISDHLCHDGSDRCRGGRGSAGRAVQSAGAQSRLGGSSGDRVAVGSQSAVGWDLFVRITDLHDGDLDIERLTIKRQIVTNTNGVEPEHWFRLITSFEELYKGKDKGMKESFAALADVVSKFKETRIERELLLRNAPMGPKPGTQQRPEAFHRIDVNGVKPISIFIAGILAGRMIDGLMQRPPFG